MTRPSALTVEDYATGVMAGDRSVLARAITLVESQSAAHQEQAQELLRRVLPAAGKSKRVGISGAPGAGKSTFIEALGMHLIGHQRTVAVLAIDPSSLVSGGSILGDKTRMEQLGRAPGAFIRPSPAAGNPGGVARATRQAMLLCEAAGFEVVIVESVGVGQSETALRSMVDFVLLLLIPNAGDDLQGMKKGIMEIADGILINKADGPNRLAAEQARLQQQAAVSLLRPATEGWKTDVMLGSAMTGDGVAQVWERIEQFFRQTQASGVLAARRREQSLDWLGDLLRDTLLENFYGDPAVAAAMPGVRRAVLDGDMTPAQGAAILIAAHRGRSTPDKV